jgi:hypothetical protein
MGAVQLQQPGTGAARDESGFYGNTFLLQAGEFVSCHVGRGSDCAPTGRTAARRTLRLLAGGDGNESVCFGLIENLIREKYSWI